MPLRLKLPLLFGSISYLLIGWEFYNESVIESMGMAWDTGAPIWPYQTAHILLVALNAPAWLAAVVVERSTGFVSLAFMAWIFLALILLQWWFIGVECDRIPSGRGVMGCTGIVLMGCSAICCGAWLLKSGFLRPIGQIGGWLWVVGILCWSAWRGWTCWRTQKL